MVTVRNTEGALLTEAEVRLEGGSRVIALAEVREPGALLHYFFGRSGRQVIVEVGAQRLVAQLETRWQGSDRLWLIKTQAPLTRRSQPPSESPAAEADTVAPRRAAVS